MDKVQEIAIRSLVMWNQSCGARRKKSELFLQNENIVGVFDQASHLSTLRPVCLSTRIGQMNILNT